MSGKVARTVYLPELLNEWLKQEAKRRGFSVNDLIIMALESERSGKAPEPKQPSDDALDFPD